MIAAKTLIATAALALALPAFAGTTLLDLDFESVSKDLTSLSVSNPYAPQVSFGVNAWSAASKKALVNPGDAYFYQGLVDGKTLNRGALALFDGTTVDQATSFVITVAQGFDTSLDFSYSSWAAGLIEVLDSNGSLITDLALPAYNKCADTSYLCDWSDTKIDLKGQVGHQIRVSGISAQLVLDDFTLQRNTGTQVPEPGGVALSLAALGALAWSRKRNSSK